MRTQRVQIKAALPWLVRACRAGTRNLWYCLGCPSRPCTKYFFSSTGTISLTPLPSKLGRQPCWVACLLVCVSAGTPRTFLHPLVSYGSISYCTCNCKFFFLSSTIFTFPVNYKELRHFISVAIFPLICKTVILAFGALYTPFTAVTA
jgi:hypothetical protein